MVFFVFELCVYSVFVYNLYVSNFATIKNVNAGIALHGNPISELWNVT